MAGESNRAVENTAHGPAPVIQVPPGATIEGLPTSGFFGRSPAMSIGVIMFLAQFAVRYAVAQGYVPPITPEIQAMADKLGPDAALIVASAIVSLPALIQAYWTKLKVFSPRSVYKRYFAPLFIK